MAGIYIHIPYCKTRCIYCDFFTQTNMELCDRYVEAACNEITVRKNYIGNEIIDTIYFGGGTPSLLSEKDFRLFFNAIERNFKISENPEITLEANPDDLSAEYLKSLIQLPFNRLSVGIQSFNNNDLAFLNRRHTADKAILSIKMAQDAGFENISIDIMYGLPNQTVEKHINNINTALELEIQHISAYHLIYEPDTPLYSKLEKKQICPVDEEISLEMFSEMINRLKQDGFIHYEISNFGKENFLSRHNTSYWKNIKYLGIGPGAHSYNQHTREFNVLSIPKYIEGIKTGKPDITTETLNQDIRYNEFILTGLRTIWGVNLIELKKTFGKKYSDYCLQNSAPYLKKKMLNLEKDRIFLSEKGIFVSDMIMSSLMIIP